MNLAAYIEEYHGGTARIGEPVIYGCNRSKRDKSLEEWLQ